MGVVYKAYDTLMHREVALKTLRDVASKIFVDLFYRECSVLSAMVHPNIVEIFDMGEYDEQGVSKPYFVMPLLPGKTLYDLIYPTGTATATPLPVQRCVDIMFQACRGLHAAHECGLLHRDIKPRNIFVMRDDAVKLIDFGVVRLLGDQTVGTRATIGTLHYMAPEQITMKPLTARSDIFSLATVCYEALTGVQPFLRSDDTDTAAAVADHVPPLASNLNPNLNRPLAQVIAQAMAKEPRNRFETAAAFGDALQQSMRNAKAAVSLHSNPRERLQRAQRSFARGDLEFANEILEQLEAEGYDEPEAVELRGQLNEARRKHQSESGLSAARRCLEEQEYVLALRRVNEALEAHPADPAALALKDEIERRLNESQIAESLSEAQRSLDAGSFGEARALIQSALRLQPGNEQAHLLLIDAERREREWPTQRAEQEKLFRAAQAAHADGHFETAVRTLEELAALTRASKAGGSRVADYEALGKRVRADFSALQSALSDARKLIANDDLDAAQLLAERLHARYPSDPEIAALLNDIAARRAEREAHYRSAIYERISAEPDLTAQLHILNQAIRARPTDDSIQRERERVQAKLNQLNEHIDKAREYERHKFFDHAVEEWLCVRDLHPDHPGLSEQIARLRGLWEEQRARAKAEFVASVQQALDSGDHQRAEGILQTAQAEFQDDPEYQHWRTIAQATSEAYSEADALLKRIVIAEQERRYSDIALLSQVIVALCKNVPALRPKVFEGVAECARRITPRNWRIAAQLLNDASTIGPVPEPLRNDVKHQEREEFVAGILGEQRPAELEADRERIAAALTRYPAEPRLEDRLRMIDAALADKHKENAQLACAGELKLLLQELADSSDYRRLWDVQTRARALAAPYPESPEVDQQLALINAQVSAFEQGADALSRDRIHDCFELCDTMLAQRPGHKLFLQLREKADVRHRELGDEYFIRVERWLASEPNVYKRRDILQRALEQYSYETRYTDELRETQREIAQAEAVAAKALDFEKRGLTVEALAQWRQLRNIQPGFPSLNEHIEDCESALERYQQKSRAIRFYNQGQKQLQEGNFSEGYQSLQAASEIGGDIADLLKDSAPLLVQAARTIVATDTPLAEKMIVLAQNLSQGVKVPRNVLSKVQEARKATALQECLRQLTAFHAAGDLQRALETANSFLSRYPGVQQVEAARRQLAGEIEQRYKDELRATRLAALEDIEEKAAAADAHELPFFNSEIEKISVTADPAVKQRAARAGQFIATLGQLHASISAGDLIQARTLCSSALATFPSHPLFEALGSDLNQRIAKAEADYAATIKQKLADEPDFFRQATLLQDALAKQPNNEAFHAAAAVLQTRLGELAARIENARSLEARKLYSEAGREWESLRKEHPWYGAPSDEIERLSELRRKGKQEAFERWRQQVEEAIDSADYETASAMIRQAEQQQPQRTLQELQKRLAEAEQKKLVADAEFARGSRLLADGDLAEGGDALVSAFRSQPANKRQTDVIAALLLKHIEANLETDFEGSEKLVSNLKAIQPAALPQNLLTQIEKQRTAAGKARTRTHQLLEEVAGLALQAEQTASRKTLTAINKSLFQPRLLNSPDREVRRAVNDLLRKNTARLNGLSVRRPGDRIALLRDSAGKVGVKVAMLVVLASAIAAIVFFISRPRIHADSAPFMAGVSERSHSPREIMPDEQLVEVSISGALPNTRIRLDGADLGTASAVGAFNFQAPAGPHVLELSLDGFSTKTIHSNFLAGQKVSLARDAVTLEPAGN